MSRKLSIAILILSLLCIVTIIETDACMDNIDPPVAVLDAVPATVGAGMNVILDGSGSYDPDGSIFKYWWDWTNDGNYDYYESSSNHTDGAFDGNTPHAYSSPGTYTAKLLVMDDGSPLKYDTDTCTITVLRVTNMTQNTGYTTIQAALDEAANGDEIVVYPDTYYENIDFNGVSCTLRSSDPNDFDIIGTTVIDGRDAGAVITCDTGSVISGFTITNGTYGIDCDGASPTITRCFIEDNSSAGIYLSSNASPTIRNNWIYDNDTGISFSSTSFSGTICNNTIVDNNSFGIKGVSGSSVTITNCILWNNNDDLSDCTATYSCIESGDSGTGNISSYPYFADYANNDFHITLNSPCINRGDPNGSYTGQTDIDGDDRVAEEMFVDARVDIGADESGTNLVKNPGFELGGGGWTMNRAGTSGDIPLYWQDQWLSTAKTIDSSEKHSGSYSWKFQNDANEYSGAHSDFIEVDPNKVYWLSAWIKCQPEDVNVGHGWEEYDNNQDPLSYYSYPLNNHSINTEWTKFNRGYVLNDPNAAYMRLRFFGPYRSPGTVWWDDFSLTAGTEFLPPYGDVNVTDIAESVDFGGAETNIDRVKYYSTRMSGKLTDSGDNNITYRELLAGNDGIEIEFPAFNLDPGYDANDSNDPNSLPLTPMLLEIMYRDDTDDMTTGDIASEGDLVMVSSRIGYIDLDPAYVWPAMWANRDYRIAHLGGVADNEWKYMQYAFQKSDFQLLRAIDGNFTIIIKNNTDVNLPIDYVSLRKISQVEYEDLTDKQRAARGFYEAELPEDAPAEPNYTDSNITVFTRDIMRPVYRYTMPRADEVDANITGFSAWGETEPVSFSIYSENSVNDLTITVSDLTHADSYTISSSDISIYHVIYDETRFNYTASPKCYALVPDRLEEFGTLSVEPDTSESIWLKIKVPDSNDGKPSGLYHGNVTIARTGESNVNVPIDFDVYDITLDGPNHINLVHDPYSKVLSSDLNVVYEAYRQTGLDPFIWNWTRNITITDNNKVPAFDSNNYEAALDRIIAEGCATNKVLMYPNSGTWQKIYKIAFGSNFDKTDANIYYDLSDANFVSAFESLLARYEQIADDRNLEFIYMINDEPGNDPYSRIVADRIYTIIHDYNEPNEPNDLQTASAYHAVCDDEVDVSSTYNTPNDINIPALTDLVDYKYWAPNYEGTGYDRHNDPNDPNYHGRFGYYTTGISHFPSPVYNRFFHGLFAFGTDAEVVVTYAMGHYNDPYNDFAAGYKHIIPFTYPDFLFAYPTWSGKLLYTIGGLEAIREGIKDAKYIKTLRNIIDDPNTDPDDPNVIAADGYLDDLHDRIDPNFTNYYSQATELGYYSEILEVISDTNDPNDFEEFADIRKTIADYIRDIQP